MGDTPENAPHGERRGPEDEERAPERGPEDQEKARGQVKKKGEDARHEAQEKNDLDHSKEALEKALGEGFKFTREMFGQGVNAQRIFHLSKNGSEAINGKNYIAIFNNENPNKFNLCKIEIDDMGIGMTLLKQSGEIEIDDLESTEIYGEITGKPVKQGKYDPYKRTLFDAPGEKMPSREPSATPPAEPAAPAADPSTEPTAPATPPVKPEDTPKKPLTPKETINLREPYVNRIQIELQKIATEVGNSEKGRERDVKIDTSKIPYAIFVDGKKTSYVIDISVSADLSSPEKFKNTLAIKKPGEQSPYRSLEEWQKTSYFKEQFKLAIAEVPNEKSVANLEESLQKLREIGLTISKPEKVEKLSVHQFDGFAETTSSLILAIQTGPDAYSILSALDNADTVFMALIAGTEIKELQITKPIAFTWTESAPTDKEAALKAIIEYKKQQFGEKSPEFITFMDKTSSKDIEDKYQKYDEKQKAVYRQNYKQLSEKTYLLDERIDDLSEEDIAKVFENIDGSFEVIEILGKSPFGIDETKAGKIAAAIISEGDNKEVEFEDIFEIMEGFPMIDKKIIPLKYLKDADDFMEEYERLRANAINLSKEDLNRLHAMGELILIPCFQLLDAMSKLNLRHGAKIDRVIKGSKGATVRYGEKEGRVVYGNESYTPEKAEELPQDQKEILEGLRKLCFYSERSATFWETILASFSRDSVTGKFYMSDMDGQKYQVDEGLLRRYNDPEAVLAILTNRREPNPLYSGEPKRYNEQAVTAEINRLMKLGLANELLQKSSEDTSIQLILQGPEFKALYERYQIKSITDYNNFTEEQMLAFQRGFLIDEGARFDSQVDRGIDALTKEPKYRQIVEQCLSANVPKAQILKIQERMAAMGAFVFENGKFKGGALGIPIDIGDNFKFILTAGGINNPDGSTNFIGSIGFGIKIYNDDNFSANIGFNVDISGASLGASQTVKTPYVNISFFEGLRWSFASAIPTIGGGMSITKNTQASYERQLEEAKGKTNYQAVWEKWRKNPGLSVEERYAMLKEIPAIWNTIQPLQEAFGLSNADVIQMVKGIEAEITSKVLDDLHNGLIDLPLLNLVTEVGFVMVGPIPVPVIGFRIGSAKVYIPNRQAIARMRGEMSDAEMTQRLEQAVKELESGKHIEGFINKTPDLAYDAEGNLMIRLNEGELNIDHWRTDPEKYNEKMQAAEIQLETVGYIKGNPVVKLNIHNLDDKDTQILMDPALKDLTIGVGRDAIFLAGDISGLIITRERFFYPKKPNDARAYVQDRIVIRKRSSVRGQRDATWMQKYSTRVIQRLNNQSSFKVHSGNAAGRGMDSNIIDLTREGEGFSKMEAMLEERRMEKPVTDKEIATIKGEIQERRKALKAIEDGQYEKQEVDPELFNTLDKLYKKPSFKREFMKHVGEPAELAKLLAKTPELKDIGEKGHERDLNLAMIYLINKWFTTLYPRPLAGKELSKEQIRRGNLAVAKRLKQNIIPWVKKYVFVPEFRKAIDRINARAGSQKINMSAEQIASIVTEDLYGLGEKGKIKPGSLLDKLLNDKNFDFRNVEAVGLPKGAFLFSGSRMFDRRQKGVFGQTVSYENMPKQGQLVHDFGFLKDTIHQYDLKGPQKDIARVLLEVASPIPEDNEKFLNSPLAVKIAAMSVHRLLAGEKDYKLITEAFKNRALANSEPHKGAIERFRSLVKEIRTAEIEGKPYIKEMGNGMKVIINMGVQIVAGGYTKCGNGSFYLLEKGEAVVKNEENIALYSENTEQLNSELTKKFYSVTTAFAFTEKELPPPGKPGEKIPPPTIPKGKPHEKPGLNQPDSGYPGGDIPTGGTIQPGPTHGSGRPDGNIPSK
ncbi:hypothetical protein HY604_03155 [Candidatus Peregrinibacteria bacterium]|nr:hypothetical protein [Candidatus Peregrinibacteria bacterium]